MSVSNEADAKVKYPKEEEELVVHSGSCHCGAVRWEARAPAVLTAVDCDCSVCAKKANLHFIVPRDRFRLLQGSDGLTSYRFNTRQAEHLFCSVCGVQSFYTPRSHPGAVGVNPRCIDSRTVQELLVRKFDGRNWEQSVAQLKKELP